MLHKWFLDFSREINIRNISVKILCINNNGKSVLWSQMYGHNSPCCFPLIRPRSKLASPCISVSPQESGIVNSDFPGLSTPPEGYMQNARDLGQLESGNWDSTHQQRKHIFGKAVESVFRRYNTSVSFHNLELISYFLMLLTW